MQYRLSMGGEKVCLILSRHKANTRQMVAESLDNGWKTRSAQATELQLLSADHENREKQGQGFFKMDEATIATIQEELAHDIYELSTRHKEEITKLMEEYEDQQMATVVELDTYEKEHRQQTGELEANSEDEPTQEESGQKILVRNIHQEDETEQEVEVELMLRMEEELNTGNPQN